MCATGFCALAAPSTANKNQKRQQQERAVRGDHMAAHWVSEQSFGDDTQATRRDKQTCSPRATARRSLRY